MHNEWEQNAMSSSSIGRELNILIYGSNLMARSQGNWAIASQHYLTPKELLQRYTGITLLCFFFFFFSLFLFSGWRDYGNLFKHYLLSNHVQRLHIYYLFIRKITFKDAAMEVALTLLHRFQSYGSWNLFVERIFFLFSCYPNCTILHSFSCIFSQQSQHWSVDRNK